MPGARWAGPNVRGDRGKGTESEGEGRGDWMWGGFRVARCTTVWHRIRPGMGSEIWTKNLFCLSNVRHDDFTWKHEKDNEFTLSFLFVRGHSKKVYRELDHRERCGFLHGVQHVTIHTLQNFGCFRRISWEFMEQKNFKFLQMDQNWFHLIN